MRHDPTDRISLHPHHQRVTVSVGEAAVADTRHAIELREEGYPPRQYIPRADVFTDTLEPSETVTHCPFKGNANYFSIILGHHRIADAAWSYEQPKDAVRDIAGFVCFDQEKVEQTVL